MTWVERFRLMLTQPRKAWQMAGDKWAMSRVRAQIMARANDPELRRFPRDHYGWRTIEDDFHYLIFCVQETNLVNFVHRLAAHRYETVLEVGSASDLFLREFDADCKIGVNVLPVCVDKLKSQGIEGRLSDGTHLPAEDGEADLVFSFQTLEHVPDPIGFLRELARVVKPNGRLAVSIPDLPKTNIRAKYYDRPRGEIDQPDSEFHIFEFSPADFRAVASHADLRVVAEHHLPTYRLRYDPLTNRLIRQHVSLNYFPGVVVFELCHAAAEPGESHER